MSELVVAIDAGTTGVRSMVLDTSGGVIARAYEEFPSGFPNPSWVEQDAEMWWRAICSTLMHCTSEGGVSTERIAGVSVTNQRETIVPVDEDGRPLRRAIVWQDRRTVPQCDRIRRNITAERVYSITGLTVDPYFSAPKILWIGEHEPDVFSRTYRFLLVHDYVVHRLTGRFVTDHSNASRTMLFDIGSATWSDDLLEAMGIDREKLPEPVGSGTPVGEVSSEAARQTGLRPGTPVVAGGGDQQCAALGVGVVREGSIKATTGTGTFLLAFSAKKRLDPDMRLLCSRHVLPDAFVVEASMFTTGSALRWFRDNLGEKECDRARERGVDPYDLLIERAAGVPPGSEGVIHIPHFAGAGAPHWNPNARGVFAGLALGHTRGHLIRAILEGVAYEIRTNLELMRQLGLRVGEVRVTGGAAKSSLWLQIQSDVLNVPIVKAQLEEATSMGAAILACVGVGVYRSAGDAAVNMVRTAETLTPNGANRAVYDGAFMTYTGLYNAIADIVWDVHQSE